MVYLQDDRGAQSVWSARLETRDSSFDWGSTGDRLLLLLPEQDPGSGFFGNLEKKGPGREAWQSLELMSCPLVVPLESTNRRSAIRSRPTNHTYTGRDRDPNRVLNPKKTPPPNLGKV